MSNLTWPSSVVLAVLIVSLAWMYVQTNNPDILEYIETIVTFLVGSVLGGAVMYVRGLRLQKTNP